MVEIKKSSRKLSILVAVLILFVGIFIGGYLVLKSNRGAAGQLSAILNGQEITSCQPNPNDSNSDADNDGLKDWQETQVYKSDPCKTDTDGDGYLDGEEVVSGYDPTKKAPGDELPGTLPKIPRPLPNNLTEALRQKLSGQILQDKISIFNEKGEILSEKDLQNYPGIQQTIWETIINQASLFAPDEIKDGSIKISTDNSQKAIKKYLSETKKLFFIKKTSEYLYQSEAEMFLAAIEKNEFSELDFFLQSYQKLRQGLENLIVPSSFLALHQKEMNIYSQMIKIYQAVRQGNDDPLKAYLALQNYQPLIEDINSWLSEFNEFAKNNLK